MTSKNSFPAENLVSASSTRSQALNTSRGNRLVVGLTGGIGSGKSATSAWFAKQGIDIIDADVIAHDVVAKGSTTLRSIQKKFGDWVINAAGEMDRAAVRTHVFTYPEALVELESITHPAIREAAREQLLTSTSDYIILSAPLLIEAAEAGLANLCQRILVIDAFEDTQLERASQRDEQSLPKIKAIMANQLNREQRNSYADDVVINNDDLATLYAQLEPLHQDYLRLAQQIKYAVD